jgi:23S rRNA (cytosine1962-C5)-methyltransferase
VKPPCLIFEDDHLLVVNKPPGLNTHSPSAFAGEGLYEWLRHREPRWANLAIIHRLDKETSGLIVFSKTVLANRSLTEQFAGRSVAKKYVLLTDRTGPRKRLLIETAMVRAGDKYFSRPLAAGAEVAQTSFMPALETHGLGPGELVEAEPLTGRTHQIRVHAADQGFPVLGDVRYGGTPGPRLCLHAAELSFKHPVSGRKISFMAPPDFRTEPGVALRRALINPQSSSAFRLVHGASDGWPGWYVDRLGLYLHSQSAGPITETQLAKLSQLANTFGCVGAYHKQFCVYERARQPESSLRLVLGSPAPERFTVLENGLRFALSFAEGSSVGLFLDQRDNRRRLLTGAVAAGFPVFESRKSVPEVLNAFAYTCGFSIYAGSSDAHTTSLDLSKKCLDWGRDNFVLNQINSEEHDFIFGDVFDWLRRFQKKARKFDLIVLDPPTFSRSKQFGAFRAEKDYSKLVTTTLPLLESSGLLLASCNTASWPGPDFLAAVRASIKASKRAILQDHYFPQPPDFPISRGEPAYLKTYWVRVA